MLSPAQMFRILNEMVFVLLGGLLILLTATGRFSIPRGSRVWLGLGIFLIYWGLRVWWRSGHYAARWEHRLRGGSLVLVGMMVLATVWLPVPRAACVLGAAGGVLALRGLAAALLAARTPRNHVRG